MERNAGVPQDSLPPKDAVEFQVTIDRDFTFELRRQSGEIQDAIRDGSARGKRMKRDKFIFKAAAKAVGLTITALADDRHSTNGDSGGELVAQVRNAESHRDLGNLFMARLMAGYGDNTVSVSDSGIEVVHKTTTKAFEWPDIEWWLLDDFALMVSTTAQLTLAIPADQLPDDGTERMFEYLRLLGPERAPQVRKLPESRLRDLWKRAG